MSDMDDFPAHISESIGILRATVQANQELAGRDRTEMRHDLKNILLALQVLPALAKRVSDVEIRVGSVEQIAAFVERIKQNGKGAVVALLFGGALAVEGVHKGMDTIVGWVTK